MYPFATDDVFVRNAWYVIAWSHEVGDAPLGRRLMGEQVVLYRDSKGAVACLDGHCPHRQYPLARGRVEGDHLRCAYHGFAFGADGACVDIPSADSVGDCRVRAYPVVEKWRWIWVWAGDPARADEALIPDHHELGFEGGAFHAVPSYRLPVAGRYQLLNENLLDLSHILYLHNSKHIRSDVWRREQFERDPGGRWQRSTRVLAVPEPPPLAPFADVRGEIELVLTATFYPPAFHVGRQVFREVDKDGTPGRHILEERFFHFFTPETAHDSIYYFALARDFAHDDEALTASRQAYFNRVLDEDKEAIEAIEPRVDVPGRAPDVHCPSDAGALRGRKSVQAMIDLERAAR
ncbi:MAG: Rieske 2Fe-2S domain-containing protein [Hyphomonadaceae bacterium]